MTTATNPAAAVAAASRRALWPWWTYLREMLTGSPFLEESQSGWHQLYEGHISFSVAARRNKTQSSAIRERIVKDPGSGDPSAEGSGGSPPIIATCFAATTRGIKSPSFGAAAAFKTILPSFVAHAEAGFECWIYIAYDADDPWYNTPAIQTSIAA